MRINGVDLTSVTLLGGHSKPRSRTVTCGESDSQNASRRGGIVMFAIKVYEFPNATGNARG